MNIRQLTISTIAVVLTAFTLGATAGPGNKDNRGKSGHEQQKDKPDKQQVVESREHNRDHDDRWDNRDHDDRWDNDGRDRDDNDSWGRGDDRYNHGWRSNDHKGNENSNRQSDPDSTRGLERAAERRSDNANQHHVQSEEERPRRWYDFMTGRDDGRVENREVTERQSRWWWPFN